MCVLHDEQRAVLYSVGLGTESEKMEAEQETGSKKRERGQEQGEEACWNGAFWKENRLWCACGRRMRRLDRKAKTWYCSTVYERGYGYCGGTESLSVKDAGRMRELK